MMHTALHKKKKRPKPFFQNSSGVIMFLVLAVFVLTVNGFVHGETEMNGVITGNMTPVANDDRAITNENTPVNIDVVANDTDSESTIDLTTVEIINNPASGFVVSNSDGTVTYTPDAGFEGTDSFTYTVLNNAGLESNEATVMVTVVSGIHVFTAYNDLFWSEGQVDTGITLYTTGQSGLLKDYFTGTEVPVALTVAGGYIGSYKIPAQGSNANSSTDAYTVFNGVVDSEGLISYSGPNLTFAFTGLDPGLDYEFVLFGNRNHASYTNRVTITTISDVVSFTNASTPGAVFSGVTDPSVAIVNGYNTINGYVARFTNINPGADGEMVITVSSPTGQFYANALMLRATQAYDTALPRVNATNPVLNATGVPVNSAIQVTFSKPMDAGSITGFTFLVNDGIYPIGGQVFYYPGSMTAIFVPANLLSYDTNYTATITTGVRDVIGNAIPADYTWSFTTEDMFDTTPPAVNKINPDRNAARVSVHNKEIAASFTKPMDAGSITWSTFLVSDRNGILLDGDIKYRADDRTAIFTPLNPLSYGMNYTVIITTGVRDVSGNAMTAYYAWSFTTAIDEYPWVAEAWYPFDEGTGIIAGDSSGNNRHGTILGATWTTGKTGGALHFDGKGYVTIPRMNYDEISVSAWFRKNASGNNVIFGGYRWDADEQCREGFDLLFHTDMPDLLRFVVVTRNASGIKTTKQAFKDFGDSNGNWYHVVGTYNKTTGEQKLYIDGQLVNTQTHPPGNVIVPLTDRHYMAIGTRYSNWGLFNGSIDDVRIYKHALNDGEVRALLSKKEQIREGDAWRYFAGDLPPAGWNQSGFDDSILQSGPSGFGYGRERNKTTLGDMQGNYLTVHVRRAFFVDNPFAVTNMTLSIDCDGPFIVYLNGIEILRNESGLPG